MKESASAMTNIRQRRRKMLMGLGLLSGCLIALGTCKRGEPSFRGKSATYWFNQSLLAPPKSGSEISEAEMAFTELNGDAIPFLTQWLNIRPTALDRAYAKFLFGRLPQWAQRKSPKPRDAMYFEMREAKALSFLGLIGKQQRFKSDVGETNSKASISKAVPKIVAVLTNGNAISETMAVQALRDIGPSAAAAVPDLIKVASIKSNRWSAPTALEAFGTIGPAASNAVDVLIEVANSSSYRLTAVNSLGAMGRTAERAVPLLSKLMHQINYPIRNAAARCLAEIGIVPDDVRPILIEMREKPDPTLPDSINQWTRTVATFALWVGDTDNVEFKRKLAETLLSKERKNLLFSLGRLGPRALPLATEIAKLTDDPDSEIRRLTKVALRRAGAEALKTGPGN